MTYPGMSVGAHPQIGLILQRIADGLPLRQICAGLDPPLSHMSIRRYKQDILIPAVRVAKPIQSTVREMRVSTGGTPPPTAPQEVTANQRVAAIYQRHQEQVARSVFRTRLEELHTRIDRNLDRAEQQKDLAPVAPLLNQAHKNLELLGRVTGELDNSVAGIGHGLQIQIVCPSAPIPDTVRISYASPDAIDQRAADPDSQADSTENIGLQP
jgi:hypothetical protein